VTDKQTDILPQRSPRYAYASCGKNRKKERKKTPTCHTQTISHWTHDLPASKDWIFFIVWYLLYMLLILPFVLYCLLAMLVLSWQLDFWFQLRIACMQACVHL